MASCPPRCGRQPVSHQPVSRRSVTAAVCVNAKDQAVYSTPEEVKAMNRRRNVHNCPSHHFRRLTFRLSALAAVLIGAAVAVPVVLAQATVSPSGGITITSGAVCTAAAGGQTFPISITLPSSAVNDDVDVALLLDDTGSFEGEWPSVTSTFQQRRGSSSGCAAQCQFWLWRFDVQGLRRCLDQPRRRRPPNPTVHPQPAHRDRGYRRRLQRT